MKLAPAFVLLVTTTVAAGSSSSLRSGKIDPHLDTSESSECYAFEKNPANDPDLQKRMLDATKPCGYYKPKCSNLEVLSANVVYPGEGPGELNYKPYIVQFDIGVHPNIKNKVVSAWEGSNTKEQSLTSSYSNPAVGEECFEIIVKGGSDATGGCAGKCGNGCSWTGAGYAKDCMKHDVCTTYKALKLMEDNPSKTFDDYHDGFCYDLDCGDEAAQTLMNCYINYWFNDVSIVCNKEEFASNSNRYGHWSHATKLFTEGPCGNFENWASGQGIPDKSQISNPYSYLVNLLRSEGTEAFEEELANLLRSKGTEEIEEVFAYLGSQGIKVHNKDELAQLHSSEGLDDNDAAKGIEVTADA